MRDPEIEKKVRALMIESGLSPFGYYVAHKVNAAFELLPDNSFLFKNYLIDLNEFYLSGADKTRPVIKMVQFSDLHIRAIGRRLKEVAKEVNALKPELIFFTGDMVNSNAQLPLLDRFLGLLDIHIQKIAIAGNWEYLGSVDFEQLKSLYARHNCNLLLNETSRFSFKSKTVSVTGMDDFTLGHPDFEKAVKEYKASDYHIVLAHCPAHRDVISRQLTRQVPVDLILSGHTHGGQLNFFGMLPNLPAGSGSYVSGWYNHTSPPMYVSKGLGTSVLPLRFRCTAEVGVFNFPA